MDGDESNTTGAKENITNISDPISEGPSDLVPSEEVTFAEKVRKLISF